MARKPRQDVSPSAPRALSSLADLLRQRGVEVVPAAPTADPSPPRHGVGTDEPDLSRGGRVVVRRERKGHGGKTVTVVDGLAMPQAKLEELARAMRKALGCGSWVDDGRVVLQGDRPDAAAAWLSRHGAKQVTRGN
jgi:translation initiation factor 1